MRQVKEIMTGFYIGIGIYAVLIEVIGIFFSGNILSYTLGLLMGVIAAICLFHHMANTLDYALDLPENAASKYVKKQSFLRLLIMLAVLTIGMVIEPISFVTVLLGLLGLKIGALVTPVILRHLYPESYITKDEDVINEAVDSRIEDVMQE